MASELTYDLTNNGIEYKAGGFRIKVRGKSASKASVAILSGNAFLPTEIGNLGSGKFRKDLVAKAGERFGDTDGLAEALGMISVTLDDHLAENQAAEEEHAAAETPELRGTPYRIAEGGLVRLRGQVGELPQKLTNFVARVEDEVIRDDGAEAKRHYIISGEAGDKRLPRVEIPTSSFQAMGWTSEAWGLDATISAGAYHRDYVREAIERLSRGATKRYAYQHLGWRTLADGRRVYLAGNGAVDAPGVEVELDGKLRQYALPLDASDSESQRGVELALKFLEVAPTDFTIPLLSAAYVAPLAEVVTPDFVQWVWGPTGSLKSTLAALVLNHFGDFTEQTLPLSFESTANALERELFLLKDTPTVVDDWRPAISRGDEAEMAKKAQRLLRGVGNRQGRGRMNSDSSLRESYPPRGVVIATAEALPEGPAFESAISRSLTLRLDREWVDMELLTELQKERRMLGAAMLGYVRWLPSDGEDVRARFEDLRGKFRDDLLGAHPRLPTTLAALYVGFGAFLRYAVSVGAIDRDKARAEYWGAYYVFLEAGTAHLEATRGGDPASQFVRILGSLVDARGVHFRDRGSGECPGFGENAAVTYEKPETPGAFGDDGPSSKVWGPLGWEGAYSGPRPAGKFVGWVDDHFFYLEKDGAYAAVQEYANRGGIPFGIKPRSLWEALAKSGVSITIDGRIDNVTRVGGKPKRVVQIPRAAIEETA
jgi:hypothetical protein